jgi:hypothetical protein
MRLWLPLRSWFAHTKKTSAQFRRSGRRPKLEYLEDRTLPSTNWVNSVSQAPAHPRAPSQPDAAAYVTGLYFDLLHRQPGAAELSAWSTGLQDGMPRSQVASAFINSSEFRTSEILSFYRSILHREPEIGALNGWLTAMAQGWTSLQIQPQFFASGEDFANHGGTVQGWLTGLYNDILGRSPDGGGLAAWTMAMQAGASRLAVATGFVLSAENLGKLVSNDYQTFLGHNAAGADIAAWVGVLQSGTSIEQMHAAITSSQEYVYQTFGATLPGPGVTPTIVAPTTTTQTSSTSSTAQSTSASSAIGAFTSVSGPSTSTVTTAGSTPAGPATATAVQLSVGPNIDVNKEIGNQSEAIDAVDPTNPLRVFVAANENDIFPGCMVSFSTDGGVTWNPRTLGDGTDNLPLYRSDPRVAFDEFGNLFFSYLTQQTPGSDTPLLTVLLLSTDGGKSFTELKDTSRPLAFDHPEMTAGHGSVWVTYSAFTDTNLTSIAIAVTGAPVTGLGKVGAFKSFFVPGSTDENFGDVAIGPNGQVLVAMQSTLTSIGPDRILVSLNPAPFAGGVFSNVRFNSVASQINWGNDRSVIPSPDRTITANIGLAWDRSNGPHHGRVYVVYIDGQDPVAPQNPNESNVFVRFSDNNGLSWSPRIRVNDNINNHTMFFPRMDVDQTTGNLAIAWYDTRNDSADAKVDVFTTISLDGAATFLPNVQVTTGQSDVFTHGPAGLLFGDNGLNDYGDYIGLSFTNNQYHIAWTDNSTTLQGNPGITMDPFTAPELDIATATVTVTGTGGTGGPNLPDDFLEPNNSPFTASMLGSLSDPQTIANLTINQHADGTFDNDWLLFTAGRLGSLNVSITYFSPVGGDLQLRVFTVNAAGTFVQLGVSRMTGVTTQSLNLHQIFAGEPLFILVNGFNNAIATYTLRASIF